MALVPKNCLVIRFSVDAIPNKIVFIFSVGFILQKKEKNYHFVAVLGAISRLYMLFVYMLHRHYAMVFVTIVDVSSPHEFSNKCPLLFTEISFLLLVATHKSCTSVFFIGFLFIFAIALTSFTDTDIVNFLCDPTKTLTFAEILLVRFFGIRFYMLYVVYEFFEYFTIYLTIYFLFFANINASMNTFDVKANYKDKNV